MRIGDRMGRPIGQHAIARDVHAAGEADLAVDDEQLLVVAQVEERHAPG